MRTTVTLDPDVERLIRGAMKQRGISFKEALNSAARQGLLGSRPRRVRRFAQETFRMGPPQGFRWEKALSATEAMEDEELLRKLSLRK